MFLCALTSAELIFTINIGASFVTSFVAINNAGENHTVATRRATQSVAESPEFR